MKYRLNFQASITLKRTKSKIRDRSSRVVNHDYKSNDHTLVIFRVKLNLKCE